MSGQLGPGIGRRVYENVSSLKLDEFMSDEEERQVHHSYGRNHAQMREFKDSPPSHRPLNGINKAKLGGLGKSACLFRAREGASVTAPSAGGNDSIL